MPEEQGYSALTEGVYYILLALHSPLHGYGIMQLVKEMTGGRAILAPGTLYGALNSLLERGWISAVDHSGDKTRKEYCITEQGKQILNQEIKRLEELLHNRAAHFGEG